jgi:hypothetical protein
MNTGSDDGRVMSEPQQSYEPSGPTIDEVGARFPDPRVVYPGDDRGPGPHVNMIIVGSKR